jgi:tetratricopeptide (TPR) repeat protein
VKPLPPCTFSPVRTLRGIAPAGLLDARFAQHRIIGIGVFYPGYSGPVISGFSDLALSQLAGTFGSAPSLTVVSIDLSAIERTLEDLRVRLDAVVTILANPDATAGDEKCRKGAIAIQHGWYDDAVAELESSLGLYRFRSLPHLLLGIAHLHLGNSVEAVARLEDAVKYAKAHEQSAGVTAALLAAAMFDAVGRADKAEAILDAAAELGDNVTILVGLCNRRPDNVDYAARLLRLAEANVFGSPQALHRVRRALADSYIPRLDQVSAAVAALAEVCDKSVRETVAWVDQMHRQPDPDLSLSKRELQAYERATGFSWRRWTAFLREPLDGLLEGTRAMIGARELLLHQLKRESIPVPIDDSDLHQVCWRGVQMEREATGIKSAVDTFEVALEDLKSHIRLVTAHLSDERWSDPLSFDEWFAIFRDAAENERDRRQHDKAMRKMLKSDSRDLRVNADRERARGLRYVAIAKQIVESLERQRRPALEAIDVAIANWCSCEAAERPIAELIPLADLVVGLPTS